MSVGKDFTVCVNFESGRCSTLLNCVSSLCDAKDLPYKFIITSRHNDWPDQAFDVMEFRSFDLLKLTDIPLNKVRRFVYDTRNTKHILFVRDDTVLLDEDYLRKVNDLQSLHTVQLGPDWCAFACMNQSPQDFDTNLTGEHFEEHDLMLSFEQRYHTAPVNQNMFKFLQQNRWLNDTSPITHNYNYLSRKWGDSFRKLVSSGV